MSDSDEPRDESDEETKAEAEPETETETEPEPEPEAQEEAEEEPPRRKQRRKKRRKKQSAAAASTARTEREADDDDDDDRPESSRPSPVKRTGKSASGQQIGLLLGAAGLLLGAAVGWFLHAKTGGRLGGAAPAGSAGPCGAWTKQICDGAGERSAGCAQAKAATGVLPDEACSAALGQVPQTLAKLKAERASCDQLVGKLCKDLGEEAPSCKMVRTRTDSFPADRCKQMLENYDKVLAGLKRMGGPGGPPGASPHGMPGGMRPPITIPKPGGSGPPGAPAPPPPGHGPDDGHGH